MKNFSRNFSLFTLFLILSSCLTESRPAACCDHPISIMAFLDVNVPFHKQVKKEIFRLNQERLYAILAPIEELFFANEKLCPVTLDLFPLYYDTRSNVSFSSFNPRIRNCCNLNYNEIELITSRYTTYDDFDNFQTEKIKNSNRGYRQIWPCIRAIKNQIIDATNKDIIVIVYSDMIERWATAANEDGVYNFTQLDDPEGERWNLRCDKVEKIMLDMDSTSTNIGKTITECKRSIEHASDKNIHVWLVLEDNPKINSNTCGGRNILEDYALKLFSSIGLDAKVVPIAKLGDKLADLVN